jgi:ABC-type branched-subunit amino acid transport system substrate-binding protein
VGADLLVRELGVAEAQGIAISQVFPYPWDDTVAVVRDYQQALQRFAGHRHFSYYSLEGFLIGRLLVESIARCGKELNREKLISVLESQPFNLGGYSLSYSPHSHNGSYFVDLTVIGRQGRILR